MSGGPGFYRGTTHDQTPYFANKEKKMIESKKWPASFSKKLDISKVSLEVMKPWISKRITELLGVEDDIVIDYCMSQLKPETAIGDAPPGEIFFIDPKKLQISLTGFMERNTGIFVKELWELLLSAQDSAGGIPQQFIDEKKEEIKRKQEEQLKFQQEFEKRQESIMENLPISKFSDSIDSSITKEGYNAKKEENCNLNIVGAFKGGFSSTKEDVEGPKNDEATATKQRQSSVSRCSSSSSTGHSLSKSSRHSYSSGRERGNRIPRSVSREKYRRRSLSRDASIDIPRRNNRRGRYDEINSSRDPSPELQTYNQEKGRNRDYLSHHRDRRYERSSRMGRHETYPRRRITDCNRQNEERIDAPRGYERDKRVRRDYREDSRVYSRRINGEVRSKYRTPSYSRRNRHSELHHERSRYYKEHRLQGRVVARRGARREDVQTANSPSPEREQLFKKGKRSIEEKSITKDIRKSASRNSPYDRSYTSTSVNSGSASLECNDKDNNVKNINIVKKSGFSGKLRAWSTSSSRSRVPFVANKKNEKIQQKRISPSCKASEDSLYTRNDNVKSKTVKRRLREGHTDSVPTSMPLQARVTIRKQYFGDRKARQMKRDPSNSISRTTSSATSQASAAEKGEDRKDEGVTLKRQHRTESEEVLRQKALGALRRRVGEESSAL